MERIKFKLISIQTVQFALIENVDVAAKQQVKTELKFGIDPAKRQIGAFAHFNFIQEKKLLLTLEVLCAFDIKKASWEALLSGKKIQFPVSFLRHIAMLTIGTARGVLHAKTENTPYNSIVLPTINLIDIIKEDMVVDFSMG